MKTAGDCRFLFKGFHFTLVSLVCASVVGWCARASAAEEAGKGAVTYKLREISTFESGTDFFVRGQAGACQDKPFPGVKNYPEFKSTKPIYGSVQFAQGRNKTASGMLFYFALDESQGTGKGYDQLYFDQNRDLDLRNDTVLKPQRNPPERARLPYNNIKQQALFDSINLGFDCGPAGQRAVQILPRLHISLYDKEEYTQMSFLRTRLYEGDIKLGEEEFRVRLGEDYSIGGRLDTPGTALILSRKDSPSQPAFSWWGGDRLTAIHKADGTFFTFSASPVGDQLTVRPYQGDLGIFKMGPGNRKLDKLTVNGSLQGEDRAVAVEEEAGSCQIPVGDYLPAYLTMNFGHLRINISQNYHSDGKPRGRSDPPVYGFTIRKDKPFVLDFSNKPEVMFASPGKDQRIKVGDTLEVKAVLTDPKLDIMIRGLEDTTRKKADGGSNQRNLQLDPTVIITRTNGEKVAEGVMPFG